MQAKNLINTLIYQYPQDPRGPYLYAALVEKTSPEEARAFYQMALSRAHEEDVSLIKEHIQALSQ